jgi:hypothetical protein
MRTAQCTSKPSHDAENRRSLRSMSVSYPRKISQGDPDFERKPRAIDTSPCRIM